MQAWHPALLSCLPSGLLWYYCEKLICNHKHVSPQTNFIKEMSVILLTEHLKLQKKQENNNNKKTKPGLDIFRRD